MDLSIILFKVVCILGIPEFNLIPEFILIIRYMHINKAASSIFYLIEKRYNFNSSSKANMQAKLIILTSV